MAQLPKPGEGYQMSQADLDRQNAASPPTGLYYARIFKFIHIGTRTEKNFAGVMDDINKFRMYFELVSYPKYVFDEKKGPQPWTCNIESTYSTGEKSNLFKYIKQTFKDDPAIIAQVQAGTFDISSMMNKLVTLAITRGMSGKGKATLKVTNVTSPMELAGYDLTPLQTCPLYNPIVVFDINEFIKRNPADIAAFAKLHSWERKDLIAKTHEWQKANLRLEDFAIETATANAAPAQGYSQPGNQDPDWTPPGADDEPY